MKVLYLCGLVVLTGLCFAEETQEMEDPYNLGLDLESKPEQCATVKHLKCSKPDNICTPNDKHCTFSQVCEPFFVKKCCKIVSVERKCKFVHRCVPKYQLKKTCEQVKQCPPKKICKNVCTQEKIHGSEHKVKSVCTQKCTPNEHAGHCKFVHRCFKKWFSEKVCGPVKTCWNMKERKCREVNKH